MNLSKKPTATLEQVHISEQLNARIRSTRSVSDERINNAILTLNHDLSVSPENVLQYLAQSALVLCNAHTAGVSLLEHEEAGEVFRWRAMAGVLTPAVGLPMARHNSPCGMVLDRQDAMLFTYPEKHFPFPAKIDPPIVEVLLMPFFDEGEPVGTIWLVAHDLQRKFDSEDVRIVRELSKFTTSAYSQLRALGYVKDLRLHRAVGGARAWA
jgi:hypothetical protein